MKLAAAMLAEALEMRAQLQRLQGQDDGSVCANELRAHGCNVVSGFTTYGQPMVIVRADDVAEPTIAARRDALLQDFDARGLGHVLVVISHAEAPPSAPPSSPPTPQFSETPSPTETR